MALIKPVKGIYQKIENCFSWKFNGGRWCYNGKDCSVWFSAVVRGDVNTIKIGDKCNIQDGAVIQVTYQTSATTIGNNVSIGHNALVHGCTIQTMYW